MVKPQRLRGHREIQMLYLFFLLCALVPLWPIFFSPFNALGKTLPRLRGTPHRAGRRRRSSVPDRRFRTCRTRRPCSINRRSTRGSRAARLRRRSDTSGPATRRDNRRSHSIDDAAELHAVFRIVLGSPSSLDDAFDRARGLKSVGITGSFTRVCRRSISLAIAARYDLSSLYASSSSSPAVPETSA